MHGNIMTISRLRIQSDGPGISSLVAFWSCPLHCKYCANQICHESYTYREFYSVEKLIRTLEQDDIYFKMTDGGIVFGGGEPLLQSEFIHEVCQHADPLWKIRLQTSLYSEWEQIRLLLDDIDEWIIDIKDMNPEIYRKYTGQSNSKVLSNLSKMITAISKEQILIRVPYIPGFNDSNNVKKSVKALTEMGYSRIEQFKYHILNEE